MQGHAVDLISCSLDQTGLLEQKKLARNTGGLIVTTETFMNHIYETSLTKLFSKDEVPHQSLLFSLCQSGNLLMGFNLKMEVLNSPELKVSLSMSFSLPLTPDLWRYWPFSFGRKENTICVWSWGIVFPFLLSLNLRLELVGLRHGEPQWLILVMRMPIIGRLSTLTINLFLKVSSSLSFSLVPRWSQDNTGSFNSKLITHIPLELFFFVSRQ